VKFVALAKETKPVNDPIRSLSKTGGQYPASPPRKIEKFFEKIKIDGNKTVYFDTISTDLNNLNLQSSLTYWRLKNARVVKEFKP